MSTSYELTTGDIRSAMHQVIPEVAALATPPPAGGYSPIERQPEIVRDRLRDAINADTVKIGSQPDERARIALAKLESYTLLGACGAAMTPIMFEDQDAQARYAPAILAVEDTRRADITLAIKPMFNYGYHILQSNNPWINRVQKRFATAWEEYSQLRGERVPHDLRLLLDGGALGPTMHSLTRLTRTVEQGTPGYTPPTAETLPAHLDKRYDLMRSLAYLGITRAGVNIGQFLLSEPLERLKGHTEIVRTKDGDSKTVFKRESRDNMREVFPASTDDWLSTDMDGPTLKCPLHQKGTLPGIPSDTFVTGSVEATLAFMKERPYRFLMSEYERGLYHQATS
jgi:hypothetical protein